MVKEEILTGIKNGLARGESIQEATQTLIAAGYNPEEVNEAANSVNTGVLSRMPLPQTTPTIKEIQNAVQPQQTTPQQNIPSSYQPLPTQTQKKKIPKGLMISLIILGGFLILLILLVLFGEKILDLIM